MENLNFNSAAKNYHISMKLNYEQCSYYFQGCIIFHIKVNVVLIFLLGLAFQETTHELISNKFEGKIQPKVFIHYIP